MILPLLVPDSKDFNIYTRILDPKSKLATCDSLASYYEQPDFDYQHILRSMDILEENYSKYLTWLYENSGNINIMEVRHSRHYAEYLTLI